MKKVFLAILVLSLSLFCAYFTNIETTVYQPDGTKINLFSSGDEFYNYLHDADGYKIIKDYSGNYCYAVMNKGRFISSGIRADRDNIDKSFIDKDVNISVEEYKKRVENFNKHVDKKIKTPSKGVMNNITIYIKFPDQTEFEETRSVFDEKFNSVQEDSVSLRNYYKEVSYNQFDIVTTHYPECPDSISLSYIAPYPRSYYEPYDPELNPEGYIDRTEAEHTLLKGAVEAVADQIPEGLEIDSNGDGYVDNVCFVIRGPHTAWAELLWAHKWALYSESVYINGKRVYVYTFQPENQNKVEVLAHEMFHALGAPDLYHYNFDGINPAGPWDLMETGTGHMTAYMKYYYGGWISSLNRIYSTGEYNLNPITSRTNNCLMIKPDSYGSEFYVVEYRKKDVSSFDREIPGSGLIVYRINEYYMGYGNSDGPPDELFVFREDGSLNKNGNTCNAYLSLESGRTAINDYTNPGAFNSSGGATEINIYDVKQNTENGTISFTVNFENDSIPPICEFQNYQDGAYLPVGYNELNVTAESILGDISMVEFYFDSTLVHTDNEYPYSLNYDFNMSDIGNHLFIVKAFSGEMASEDRLRFKVFDPEVPTWFTYYTDRPEYNAYNRGCIDIKLAAVYDLGNLDMYVNGISINLTEDPYGENEVPGEFNCSIYRFADGTVTDELLADLGTYVSPMTGRFEQKIDINETFTGKIALVMDIGKYHLINYDLYGIPGNNFMIEPDRPWTNIVARGVIGALDMAAQMSIYPTSIDENAVPSGFVLYNNYPNPFNSVSRISFSLPKTDKIEVCVYNSAGRIVKEFPEKRYSAGRHSLNFDASSLNSGVYYYTVSNSGEVLTGKMVYLK